jgi:GPI mannosyltransferase 3
MHYITWITLPFILAHCLVSHKELRFLFPVLYFLPVMFVLLNDGSKSMKWFSDLINRKWLKISFLAVNSLLLLYFTFKPADNISFSLKKIFEATTMEPGVLFYESDDPYGSAAALNYFKNPRLVTRPISGDTAEVINSLYFFSPHFNSASQVKIKGRRFEKIYASYPGWFSALNFNGWQDRSFSFSIYKESETNWKSD